MRLGHLGLEGTHPQAPMGAICDFWGSHQAACGAVAGTVGAPGVGGDASPSPQGASWDTLCSCLAPRAGGDASPSPQGASRDTLCSHLAPRAGGDASPSPKGAISDVWCGHQAACGAAAGAVGAPGAGRDTSPAPRAPSQWVLSAQQPADAPRGARWPTCPTWRAPIRP